jgi:hypothetical protein
MIENKLKRKFMTCFQVALENENKVEDVLGLIVQLNF